MSGEMTRAPGPPMVRFSVSVTGHRLGHADYAAHAEAIALTLAGLFNHIDRAVDAASDGKAAPTRLLTLLADGTDQTAAQIAVGRGYELICPLPFGRVLNAAINAHPLDAAEASAILSGDDAREPATRANLAAIRALQDKARLLELADQDPEIAALFLRSIADPANAESERHFQAERARRAAVAGRILIEQSDMLIAVWDGVTTAPVGGTGDTIVRALECGTPVVWIDPATSERWRMVTAPEAINHNAAAHDMTQQRDVLNHAILRALAPGAPADTPHAAQAGFHALADEHWVGQSRRVWHAYRRVEQFFGSGRWRDRLAPLTQTYEAPHAIADGSGREVMDALRTLSAISPSYCEQIDTQVLRRFAWADGISAFLSDCYRSGMTINFLLSALAISGGIAYLPLVAADRKWGFALFELALLVIILTITHIGQRRRWHDRWFETRRVAEYLRHSPILLALGVARPPGRWGQGTESSWPEHYVRQTLRGVGLPQAVITTDYLRGVCSGLLDVHVRRQRDYHRAKALRLAAVHHRLDHSSERLFQCAVLSVSIYLGLMGAAMLDIIELEAVNHSSKIFTVLGVVLPTFGAAIAGIRYFGDFERFAAISEVAANKLDAVHQRIELLLAGPDSGMTYTRVADLAHAADAIVVAEIESWQAVFAGKRITVPV